MIDQLQLLLANYRQAAGECERSREEQVEMEAVQEGSYQNKRLRMDIESQGEKKEQEIKEGQKLVLEFKSNQVSNIQ